MVKIPDSPQIQRGKTVAQAPTVRQPLNIEGAGFQVAQKAITTTQSLLQQEQLRQDRLQKEQQKVAFEQAKREQEANEVRQFKDAKNKIRKIDNQISLDANTKEINADCKQQGKEYKSTMLCEIKKVTSSLNKTLLRKFQPFIEAQGI